MLDLAKLPIEEREPYFKETAAKRSVPSLIVEKDFWVCFILQSIFTVPELKNKFVFKGGTSLLKVFHIIKRFSEDIDLTTHPKWLGFNDDDLPKITESSTRRKNKSKKIRNACKAWVENNLKAILENDIITKLGPPNQGKNYLNYIEDVESLIFNYPTHEKDTDDYIHPQIRIEIGSHTGIEPNASYTITPWIAEEFPDVFKEPNIKVVTLGAERIFWEKATIIHAENNRPKEDTIRDRHSRDLYDLCAMTRDKSGLEALQNLDLLEEVVKHKETFFYANWANYGQAKPGTLSLVPPNYRINELKSDYKQMQVMFMESVPEFDDLILMLKKCEEQINKV